VGEAVAVSAIRDGRIHTLDPVPQDRARELRYSRNADFTDSAAAEYLSRLPTPQELHASLTARDEQGFLRPFILAHS